VRKPEIDTMRDSPEARHAPATARNREPILAVLREVMPQRGTVLEIASGTGEHAVFFAAAFPHLIWQPSDPNADARDSIAAHATLAKLNNLRPPLALDAAAPEWPVAAADAIICINMIHIAPWSAAEGLMAGAGRLKPEVLFLYGPFRENGAHTAPSNEAFEGWLKAQDPAFGVRDLEDVTALAARSGYALDRRIAMPANNLSLIFRRNR
jgi:hypothetical protein